MGLYDSFSLILSDRMASCLGWSEHPWGRVSILPENRQPHA